jgi:hypothetical protein
MEFPGEYLISASIDQRVAVWHWSGSRADNAAKRAAIAPLAKSDLPEPPTCHQPDCADGSLTVEFKYAKCSSVADIQNMAVYAAHGHQFLICVGTGLEIFKVGI